MQELIITNVRKTQYRDVNLNKIFDPDNQHLHKSNEQMAGNLLSAGYYAVRG